MAPGSCELVLLVETQPAVLRHNYLQLVSPSLTAVQTFLQIVLFWIDFCSGLNCTPIPAARDCRVKSTLGGRETREPQFGGRSLSFSLHSPKVLFMAVKSLKHICNWSKLFTPMMFSTHEWVRQSVRAKLFGGWTMLPLFVGRRLRNYVAFLSSWESCTVPSSHVPHRVACIKQTTEAEAPIKIGKLKQIGSCIFRLRSTAAGTDHT